MDLPPTLAGVRETRQDHPRSSYSSEPVTPSRTSSDSNLVGKNNQLVSSCTTFELGFYVACVMSFWRKTTLPIHPQVTGPFRHTRRRSSEHSAQARKKSLGRGCQQTPGDALAVTVLPPLPMRRVRKGKGLYFARYGIWRQVQPAYDLVPPRADNDVVVSKRAMSKAGAETTRTRRNGTGDNALKRPPVPTLNKAR